MGKQSSAEAAQHFSDNCSPEAEVKAGQLPSEIRIVRLASIYGDNSDMETFLNRVGRMNYGKGRAKSLGSIAVTVVKATELGRMVEAKYPKVHSNRRKLAQLNGRIAGNYKQFVRSEATHVDHMLNQVMVEPTIETGMDEDEYEAELSQYLHEQDGLKACSSERWHDIGAAIFGIGQYSRDGLGFDLSTNESLWEEHDSTRAYLRAEGFNTNFMDPDWKPHAVFFEANQPRYLDGLKLPANPNMIFLDAPTMLKD